MSIDSPADNGAFREKFGFPYDLLSDENQEMSTAYGVPLRDTGRTDRVSVLIGPDGKIAAAYGAVTPADHPAEVLAELDRLG